MKIITTFIEVSILNLHFFSIKSYGFDKIRNMWKIIRLMPTLIVAYLFLIFPAIAFKRWTTSAYRYRMIRRAVNLVFPMLHIDLNVDHPEYLKTKEPYLIVSNHHGMLDPYLTIHLMEQPLRFVSKKDVRYFPIFGDATAAIDAIFIDRKDIRSQVRAFIKMKESLARKETRWVIYPEGTRNKQLSQPMLPFKPGSFKHAMDTQTTILPMVAFGFHRPIDTHIHMRRYPVQVDFLPPITPAMYVGKTTQEVADMIQAQMQSRSLPMIEKDKVLTAAINKKR
jgi:1-acyl-sn-glycerol-3-phosphate acyltransferase